MRLLSWLWSERAWFPALIIGVPGCFVALQQIRKKKQSLEKAGVEPSASSTMDKSNELLHQVENAKLNVIELSPLTIRASISRAPLYRQEELSKDYVGMQIQLVMVVVSIDKRRSKLNEEYLSICGLYLHHGDVSNSSVCCHSTVEDFPFLRILQGGQHLRIIGRIKAVEPFFIKVAAEHLEVVR